MSETLNVNVLVAAKEEYTRQLVSTIQHDIYDILKSIFNDSQEKNVRRKISYSNFQLELKEVPQWTSYKLDSKIKDLVKKYSFLMDLITAIFVSHVKILACVRLKSDNKSIKIKVPNLSTFLHKLLIKCCETLYYEPHTINLEKYRVIEIISVSIEDTIANQVPIEYILSEYLAGAFDDEPEDPINLGINPEVNTERLDEINSDNESDVNSEEGECKNIKILPIKNRVGFKESLNNVKDEDFNSNDNDNDNKYPEIESEKIEPKIEPKGDQILNKSTKIEDISDEEYSDEDISGEELSDEEDVKVKQNRSLF
jgi:hypothetical protein